MNRLSLSLLGIPEVQYAGRPLKFATRKVLALLIYLAVEQGEHTREKLIALLWPESDLKRGQASLRNTLTRLRDALGQAERLLVIADDRLGISADVELDAHTLAATMQVTTGDTLARLLRGAALYRGDFLESFSLPDAPDFEEWVGAQRAHWQRRMSLILERLAGLQNDAGDSPAAIETAIRWVKHDPLDEAAYHRLMKLYVATNNQTAALKTYEACRAILAQELHVEPSPATVSLAEQIRMGPATAGTARTPRAEPALPFVGRSAQYAQLVNAYYTARRVQPQVVVLEGEPGIGKTRLATEFIAWATAQGADLLHGRAFDAGGRLPYQPLVEALGERLDQENAPDDLLSDVWLSELSRLLPELRERYPDLPPLSGDEAFARPRLLEAVARLGQSLAVRKPVVLFIDDFQWADAASCDMLYYLARRMAENHAPVLFLLTLRSDFGSELHNWLSSLGRELPVARVPLGTLLAEDILKLLQALELHPSTPDRKTRNGSLERFSAWLFAETGGQPFFIVEMLHALVERGVLSFHKQADGTWAVDFSRISDALPRIISPGVQEMIRARLRRLTPDGQTLLIAASVVGRACRFEQMCGVAGLRETEALPVLDDVLGSRLLLETGDPARPYALAHDKIRAVIYAAAGDARRRIYHRRALETLQQAVAPPAELAQHAFAAGLDESTVRYSCAAGDAALKVFAVRDAIVYYEQARRIGGSSVPLILYRRLGRAYELSGDQAQAQSVFQQMLVMARASHQPEMECSALNHLATLAIHKYEFDAAADLLKQAIGIAEGAGNKVGLANTEWGLAQLRHHVYDFQGSKVHSERALALARELGNQELMAGTLNALGYAEMLTGQIEAGDAHMAEARALYAALGNRALEADCLTAIAAAKIWQGHAETGIAMARQARTISSEIENPWGLVFSGIWLATGLLDRGEYEEALEVSEEGEMLAQAHHFIPIRIFNLLVMGRVHHALMMPAAAHTVHLQAQAVNDSASAGPFAEMIASALCADDALAGDWERAREHAHIALARRTYTALPLVIPCHWSETEALLRGDRVDAEHARRDVRRWGELVGNVPRLRLPLLRSLAVIAKRDGDSDQALAYFQEAASEAQSIDLPGEMWPLYVAIGELRHARGEEAPAHYAFAQAAEIVQALGAKLTRENLRAHFLTAERIRRVLT